MSAYERIRRFLTEEMRQSHIYQPVMMKELLTSGGSSSAANIAQAILSHDPTQIEYYTQIVKNMVGRVLTRNRGMTTRDGDVYRLIGAEELSEGEVEELIAICNRSVQAYLDTRGELLWSHRRRGYRPISGSIRYLVLSRASFRCELCGVSADERGLEVDHIHPKSLGGLDELENYQALCYSCNAAKRNTDKQDFRDFKTLYDHRKNGCLFCDLQLSDRRRIVTENSLAYTIRDAFPVTPQHTLVITKRHFVDYFEIKQSEINAVHSLLADQRAALLKEDASISAFNVGMNCGEAAGQSVWHCHVHLIPRRPGDTPTPKGGVRHVIPLQGSY
jgi:diadenosine tetraphosphate (Ap4A) HIT family hydrolase